MKLKIDSKIERLLFNFLNNSRELFDTSTRLEALVCQGDLHGQLLAPSSGRSSGSGDAVGSFIEEKISLEISIKDLKEKVAHVKRAADRIYMISDKYYRFMVNYYFLKNKCQDIPSHLLIKYRKRIIKMVSLC